MVKYQKIILALCSFLFLNQSCNCAKSLRNKGVERKKIVERKLKLLKEGSLGEIFEAEEEGFVVKRAEGEADCHNLEQEKEKQKYAAQKFEEFTDLHKGENFYKRMIIFDVKEFAKIETEEETEIETGTRRMHKEKNEVVSYFKMARLYPPNGGDILQLYLGRIENEDLRHSPTHGWETRGTYSSYNETKEVVSEYEKINLERENIDQLCYDMGILYGFLHFVAKMDGLDVEVCLGKTSLKDEFYKVAMLDFGEAKHLPNSSSVAVKKIVYAMSIEPFIPRPTTPGFSFFRQGYLFVARSMNLEKMAEKILDNFLVQTFIQKEIIKTVLKTKYKIEVRPHIKRFTSPPACKIIYNWLLDDEIDLVEKIKNENYSVEENYFIDFIEEKLNEFIRSHSEEDFETNGKKLLFKKLKTHLESN